MFSHLALERDHLFQRRLGIGGGQGMGSFMTGRGTANLLTRTTAILATVFLALSLLLALMTRNSTNNASAIFNAPPPRSKAPYKVLVEDASGDVLLVFFLSNHAWIEKSLPLGAERWISGKLELYDGHRQMVHPDKVLDADGFASMPLTEPVYGLTDGLYPRVLAKAMDGALAKLPHLPDWGYPVPPREGRSPSFGEALAAVHKPANPEAIAPGSPGRMRLAYDELFAHQIALALMRKRLRERAGRANAGSRDKAAAIEGALPFALTGAQQTALAEIRVDLAAPDEDAAPAAGRCRLRQDTGRAARHGRCRRGREAGGADGADRNPRPASISRASRPALPRLGCIWRC